MQISRRDFMKYCSATAAVLGFGKIQLEALAAALMSPNAPTVVWLEGAGCSGCSISLLNYVSKSEPHDIADVLIDVINLAYHPTLMAASGPTAVQAAKDAYNAGNYVLVVEGGVPTAFNGCACWVWKDGDKEVTLLEAVKQFADSAVAVVCVGTCSAFGGISAAPPNPTGVRRVSQVIGRGTINVPGCPPHPDWIVWVIAQLVSGKSIQLDSNGRPTALFQKTVHELCPLRETEEANQFGQEGRCLEELGCRGPETVARCPNQLFNGGVNWCIGAGALCLGCASPSFPGSDPFFSHGGD